MFNLKPLQTRLCVEINQQVPINQSANDCRKQHGCEQTCCPLNNEFEPDKLSLMIAATGTRFG